MYRDFFGRRWFNIMVDRRPEIETTKADRKLLAVYD